MFPEMFNVEHLRCTQSTDFCFTGIWAASSRNLLWQRQK